LKIFIARQIILKTAAVWFLLITAIGICNMLLISLGSSAPLCRLFIAAQLMTHFVLNPPVLAGYIVGYRLRNNKLSTIILRLIPFTTAALTVGFMAGYVLDMMILQLTPNFTFYKGLLKVYVPALILNLIFTCITPIIEIFRRERVHLKNNIDKMSSAIERLDEKFIMLKVEGSLYRIAYEDIIYLSSHGKKTTIHTEKKDYEISQVIKELDRSLPPRMFLRIHKQYIANIRFISRIKHYEGGRYWAYLSDDDENTLPIGRKYAPILKQKLEE
jgi:hypothetical protein